MLHMKYGMKLKYLKEYLPVMGVFCLALLVRIVYNVTAVRGYVPIFDAAVYNNIAHNIVTEHCYCFTPHHATVSRAPLWPFIMAAIYLVAGEHSAYARLFFCFIGSGTCVLVYLFAKDLFGKHVALITGVIAALYAGLFYWDGWLYTESLYTFCLTAFIYSLYRLQRAISAADWSVRNMSLNGSRHWRQRLPWPWVVLTGIFLALATLTRPNGPGLLGVLCLWGVIAILARIMPWHVVVKSVLVIVVIAAIIIAPWTYRNYRVTHAFVLVSTGVGEVLVGAYSDEVFGSNPIAHGLWLPPPHTLIHDDYRYTPANETLDIEHALTWIRTHLNKMPYLLALHLKNMWSPTTFVFGLPTDEFPGRWSAQFVWKLMQVTPIPVFLLAASGLLVTWKRRKDRLLPMYLVLAMTIAENVVFYGSMRFRSPIEPLLVLFVGGFLWWLTCDEPGTLRGSGRFNSNKKSPPVQAGGEATPMVETRGFEPLTSAVQRRRSSN